MVLLLAVFGLALRLFGGFSSMLFTYDQARDAFYATDIIHGAWKIVGPPTDIPGVFHGPLFYYLLAPFYWLSQGDPGLPFFAMIVANLLAIVPLSMLVQKMFGSTRLTLLAGLLYAGSYEAISYARWLSNPAPAITTLAVYFLGMWLLVKNNQKGWILAAIGLGMSIQLQLFLLYQMFAFLIFLAIFRIPVRLNKYFLSGFGLLGAILSSYFLAEVKFHFQGVVGFWHFLSEQGHPASGLISRLENFTGGMTKFFTTNLFPVSTPIATAIFAIVLILIILAAKKKPNWRPPLLFTIFMLLSSSLVFLVSNLTLTFILVGMVVPLTILIAAAIVSLEKIWPPIAYILAATILVNNIFTVVKDNPAGVYLFQVQEKMLLGYETDLVNRTYQIADGRQFSVVAITNPWQQPTLWAYLYFWQAQKNHRPLPFYRGITNYTYVGDWVFPRSDQIRAVEFTIKEPTLGSFEELAKNAVKAAGGMEMDTKTEMIGNFRLFWRERV